MISKWFLRLYLEISPWFIILEAIVVAELETEPANVPDAVVAANLAVTELQTLSTFYMADPDTAPRVPDTRPQTAAVPTPSITGLWSIALVAIFPTADPAVPVTAAPPI